MSRAPIAHPPLISAWAQAPSIPGWRVLESALCVLFLFLYSQALIGPLFADPADPESSAILRLIWLPVYAVTLALMLLRPGGVARAVFGNPLLIGLLALTLISVLWSVESGTTIRRSFALIMTSCLGVWMAARWSWSEIVVRIASAFGLIAVLSLVFALAVPSIGVDYVVHDGAWRGVFWEKNTLGAMMAWGSIACLAALACDPRHRMVWGVLAVLCAGLVLLSTSKTALLSLMLGGGGLMGIVLSRRGFGFAALMLFGLLTGASFLALVLLIAPVELIEALGRDATLTGRTDIWVVLIDQVMARPWTGYGYQAYWADEQGPMHWVRLATSWDVPTAHNGWLEVSLAIGLPGAVVMAVLLLNALRRALSRLYRGLETYWALPFLAMMALVSISESNLLVQNDLGWVLFVMTAIKLGDRRAC